MSLLKFVEQYIQSTINDFVDRFPPSTRSSVATIEYVLTDDY